MSDDEVGGCLSSRMKCCCLSWLWVVTTACYYYKVTNVTEILYSPAAKKVEFLLYYTSDYGISASLLGEIKSIYSE